MLIPLKLVRDQPLQQQLYEQLRQLIISSRLAPDTRMPSTRMLADQFSISRMTVLLTYERLIAESYLRTVPAKGTFVSRSLAADENHYPARSGNAGCDDTKAKHEVGRPDPRLFPAGRWSAHIRGALGHLGASLADEHVHGDPLLRQAIARWLSRSRGIGVNPDQIILANDRQHALHIVARLLLRPGGRAAIESPCDPRTELLIAGSDVAVVRVPVDGDGILTDRLPAGPAALALVTPEHQRPTGAVMSLQRRQALLAWAVRSGATVIEEDSDGEFRYGSMDAPPLMSLDRDASVIHAGGFAASLGPGMMLAYLAVPQRLIGPARTAARLIGGCAGRLEQAALADLLASGGYARHLYHAGKTYLGRRDTMIGSLRRHFGERIRVGGTTAGLHLAWTLPAHLQCAAEVAVLARRFGLDAESGGDRLVLLGFGISEEHQIEAGVSRLAAALTREAEDDAHKLASSRVETNHVSVGN
jgi:GntR family transcriptional regulator/MocR family aminotransferase